MTEAREPQHGWQSPLWGCTPTHADQYNTRVAPLGGTVSHPTQGGYPAAGLLQACDADLGARMHFR